MDGLVQGGHASSVTMLITCTGAGFAKPCALLKLDFLTDAMHLLYALVRQSSFSKAQGLRETGSWCTTVLYVPGQLE